MDAPVFSGAEPPVAVTAGDMRVNFTTAEVTVAGTLLRLEPREYKVLVVLSLWAVLYPRRPVSQDCFLEIFYPKRDWSDTKVLQVYISKIRKKLRNVSGGREYIETVWNKGYLLVSPAVAHYAKPAP